jgi:hypothetical protein
MMGTTAEDRKQLILKFNFRNVYVAVACSRQIHVSRTFPGLANILALQTHLFSKDILLLKSK